MGSNSPEDNNNGRNENDNDNNNGNDGNEESNVQEQEEIPVWKRTRFSVIVGALLAVVAAIGIGAIVAFDAQRSSQEGEDDGTGDAETLTPTVVPSKYRPRLAPITKGPIFNTSMPTSPATFLIPSVYPTTSPSEPPSTTRPSRAPTIIPSIAPTVIPPSLHPTITPTFASMEPTSTPTTQRLPQFGFYLMGDTPYSTKHALLLREQIRNMTVADREDIMFTVHVGDLQAASRSNCSETAFSNVFTLLVDGPLPTFVLAGDNDWYDCDAPDAAWALFRRYFIGYEDLWQTRLRPSIPRLRNVTRWSRHQEMFVFDHNEVLFLGVNLVNWNSDHPVSVEEHNVLMEANIEWATMNIDHFFATSPRVRGVVIFGHALRRSRLRGFFDNLERLFVDDPDRVNVPVLYFHGDGHKWEVENITGWDSFVDIQVEQGGHAEPCIVEIAPVIDGVTSPLVAERDLQHVFGNGLFRVDRQSGSYPTDE